MRALLYRLASLLGDLRALQNGRIVQRLARKAATKEASKLINKILR